MKSKEVVKTCAWCGKEFVRQKGAQKFCSVRCRNESTTKRVTEYCRQYRRSKRPRKGDLSNREKLAEINQKAREEGLTYGQYMQKHGY